MIAAIAIIVLYFTLSPAIQFVEAGHRGVLMHWGAVDVSIPPIESGMRIVVPYQDTIVQVDTRVKSYQATASSASKDLQVVTTQITINYHLSPEKVNLFYKNIGLDFENKIIAPAIQEVVKQVTAKYDAVDLIQKRALVKDEIEKSLDSRLLNFDILTDVVSITDFNFSDQFTKAIEDKVTAEQNAFAEENKIAIQQAKAQQIVADAEGQKQSAIKIAEGQKQSAILQAEGNAQAIEINAAAQKKQIELVTQFLKNNPDYLDWLKTNKWNGVLPTTLMSSSGTPFIGINNKP